MDNNRFYFKISLGQNFLADKNFISKIAGIILGLEPQRAGMSRINDTNVRHWRDLII